MKERSYLTAALFACSLVVSLALGELLLRAYGFEYKLFPARVEFGWPDPVLMADTFTADEKVLWVPKGYREAVDNLSGSRPNIVFMGDSCTAWSNYSRLFKSIIDQAHPQNSFTFVNAGVGGWSSYQGLQQLERDIVPMQPQIVTIYYGWNDHWMSFGIADKNVGVFNADRSLLMRFDDWRLVQLFSYLAIGSYGDGARPRRVSEADFRANLTEMVRTARAANITPVLLTAPSSHRVGHEPVYLGERWLEDLSELVPLHRRYAEIVRAVARDEGALVVDMLGAFDQFPQEDLTHKYFVEDGIHLTSEGSWELAQKLYWGLKANGLLDKIIH